MEVKIGGTYVNGVGEKVGPLVEPNLSSFVARFKGDDGIDLHYYADGSIFSKDEPSKYDLVSEYPIGKTLTELDVKPGDVVQWGNSTVKYTIATVGQREWITTNDENLVDDPNWAIVSRAPQSAAEPAKPKRMHPDDAFDAITEYLQDCGFVLDNISFYGESGTHTYRP